MSAAFVRSTGVPHRSTATSPSKSTTAGRPSEEAKDRMLVQTNEAVIRLELQRRMLREKMQVNDNMIRDIDEHLVYVVQFKKEWLHHMRLMESERRTVSTEEATGRKRLEEHARVKWDGIMYGFLQPLRRERNASRTDE